MNSNRFHWARLGVDVQLGTGVRLGAGVLLLAALSLGQGKRTFTGIVTDSECPLTDHSRMHMGATDAECVIACIEAHGAQYVLYDGKETYVLSDQKTPEKFAAKRVTITGTLDTKSMTIRMDSMVAAK